MRILALMKYGTLSASTRQRLVQFMPFLRSHGIEVTLDPLLDNLYLEAMFKGEAARPGAVAAAYLRRLWRLLRRRDFDLIWVHSELFPYLPGAFERLAGLAGKPVICDFDDAIFHQYDRHPRALTRRLLGSKLTPLLRRAAACVCGNAYIKARVELDCPRSVIIPTVVDTDIYLPRAAPRAAAAPLVVGWIGSPSTWRYVEPLLPVLLPALARHGAMLTVIGAGPAARGIPGVIAQDWEESREVADLQAMDVGIMPLPDAEWARGKCGYKLIQYMGCGLPVIASPVGVNREIVEDGVNGFLAHEPADWSRALDRLLSDPDLRLAMGARGRSRVETHYSLASQQPVLLALIQSVVTARPALGG